MKKSKRSIENYQARHSQVPVEDVFSVTPNPAKQSSAPKKTEEKHEHNAM